MNIAIFISGKGSNMENIINWVEEQKNLQQKSKIKISLVISDNPDAKGLMTARKKNIKAIFIPATPFKTKLEGESEQIYISFLKREKIDLICLAGFMRVVKSKLLKEFSRKIINIHPSLLPKYKGLNTHQRVLENKETKTGCTVHWVDETIDGGEIIVQKKVTITQEDDEKSLAKKVMQKEHLAYREALQKIICSIKKN